jgi:hypothetical protein
MTLCVATREQQQPAHWCWAYGTLASTESELLGAWCSPGGDHKAIFDDLAERGVERIQLISVGDAAVRRSTLSPHQGAVTVAAAKVASQFVGSKRRALLAAISTAECLQRSLVGALKRRDPFASEAAAATFIARWLERADRSLSDPTTPLRRLGAPAKAPLSHAARRAVVH